MAILWIFKSPFLGFWVIQTGYWPVSFYSDEALQIGELFHSWFQLEKFLWATRGARDPNFQVVIMHASHVCSQHLFGLPVRMCGMHRTQFDHTRLDLPLLVIWSRAFLTICHMELSQSTALEQKRFELRSLSPALRNVWLLLVYLYICCS